MIHIYNHLFKVLIWITAYFKAKCYNSEIYDKYCNNNVIDGITL